MTFRPLNSKERKAFLAHVADAFGAPGLSEHVFFISAEDKYYVSTRAVEPFLDIGLRIERIGIYVGQYQHGEFRLTIEGSQLIGPRATKLIIELTPSQRDAWMLGRDVELEGPGQSDAPPLFHIVRCGVDWLGCGKVKNGTLLNYVPKERYVGATFPDAEASESSEDDATSGV